MGKCRFFVRSALYLVFLHSLKVFAEGSGGDLQSKSPVLLFKKHLPGKKIALSSHVHDLDEDFFEVHAERFHTDHGVVLFAEYVEDGFADVDALFSFNDVGVAVEFAFAGQFHGDDARDFLKEILDFSLRAADLEAEAAVFLDNAGDVLGTFVGDDFSFIDNNDAVADGLYFGEDVRGEDDRVGLAEVSDEVADLDDLLGVKADGGFVEDDDGRVADERLRDPDTLLVPFGKVLDEAVAHVIDFRHLTDFGDVTFAVELAAADFVDEVQIFIDGHVHIQRGLFGEEADELFRLVGVFEDVDPADLGFPGRGGEVAGEDIHRGGFPRAVRTEEADDLTLLDFHRNTFHDRPRAVFLD